MGRSVGPIVRWCLFAALVVVSLAPSRASAWADATVRSASARVSLDEGARAHVSIDATVRIEGGWLEALELDGLDAGLVLDPLDPVTMAPAPSPDAMPGDAPPDALEPLVTLRDDGVVVLSFTRRHAPRRGDYVVHLAYDADLTSHAVADEAGVHVTWTFPAWRHGLDSVHVELALPARAHPVIGADDEIEVGSRDEGGRAVWTLTRAHLARTREWPIEILAPPGVMAEGVALAPPAAPTRDALPSAPAAPRPPWQGGLALAIASVLVALRIVRSRALEAREHVSLQPLVPLPIALRALLVLAIGAALMGATLVGQDARVLGALALVLLALAVSRRAPRKTPPRIGSFRHVTPSLRAAARRARLVHRLGIDAWLDGTSPPGVLVLVGLATCVLRVPGAASGPCLLALALVVVTLLDATRLGRAEPPLVTLARLVALARRTRVRLDGPAIALMPVVHLDVRGVAQEARLRVLGAFPEGTLRVDVVVARMGPLGARYGLLVVAARGSEIDRALIENDAFETVALGSERIARLTLLDRAGIEGAVARLLAATEADRSPSAEAPSGAPLSDDARAAA